MDNKNDDCKNIKYEKENRYNAMLQVQKAYEIRSDNRWPDVEKIVEVIKGHLEQGLKGKSVKITEDQQRMYLWFDSDQFTGNSI